MFVRASSLEVDCGCAAWTYFVCTRANLDVFVCARANLLDVFRLRPSQPTGRISSAHEPTWTYFVRPTAAPHLGFISSSVFLGALPQAGFCKNEFFAPNQTIRMARGAKVGNDNKKKREKRKAATDLPCDFVEAVKLW